MAGSSFTRRCRKPPSSLLAWAVALDQQETSGRCRSAFAAEPHRRTEFFRDLEAAGARDRRIDLLLRQRLAGVPCPHVSTDTPRPRRRPAARTPRSRRRPESRGSFPRLRGMDVLTAADNHVLEATLDERKPSSSIMPRSPDGSSRPRTSRRISPIREILRHRGRRATENFTEFARPARLPSGRSIRISRTESHANRIRPHLRSSACSPSARLFLHSVIFIDRRADQRRHFSLSGAGEHRPANTTPRSEVRSRCGRLGSPTSAPPWSPRN